VNGSRGGEDDTRPVTSVRRRNEQEIHLSERINPELMGGMILIHATRLGGSRSRRKLDDAINVDGKSKTAR